MPRHKSRFSDLEKQFRQAGGTAAPGSALAKYIDFKSGKTKIERRKGTTLSATERKRFGVSVLPFTKDVVAPVIQTSRYQASITGFSNDGAKALSLSPASLGHEKVTVGGLTANADPSFYAALIKPIVRTGTAKKGVKSSITGIEYQYYESSSYSIPFGRTSTGLANDSEDERRVQLTSDAKLSTLTKPAVAVGFDPEVFRDKQATLSELP